VLAPHRTAQAKKLASLLKGLSAKVNLIPFNPFPETQYKTSRKVKIASFQDVFRIVAKTCNFIL
jgi:adenine C2-methylase RlmN of 23S rRNA A2503 and tRNA A37